MKKRFLERLKAARKRSALSQAKLANLLGTSQQNYQRYENGGAEPNLEQVHKLCVILGVSADWLLDLDGAAALTPASAPAAVCAECARKDAVIADQAMALLKMTEAMAAKAGSKKKTAPHSSGAPSCNACLTMAGSQLP